MIRVFNLAVVVMFANVALVGSVQAQGRHVAHASSYKGNVTARIASVSPYNSPIAPTTNHPSKDKAAPSLPSVTSSAYAFKDNVINNQSSEYVGIDAHTGQPIILVNSLDSVSTYRCQARANMIGHTINLYRGLTLVDTFTPNSPYYRKK